MNTRRCRPYTSGGECCCLGLESRGAPHRGRKTRPVPSLTPLRRGESVVAVPRTDRLDLVHVRLGERQGFASTRLLPVSGEGQFTRPSPVAFLRAFSARESRLPHSGLQPTRNRKPRHSLLRDNTKEALRMSQPVFEATRRTQRHQAARWIWAMESNKDLRGGGFGRRARRLKRGGRGFPRPPRRSVRATVTGRWCRSRSGRTDRPSQPSDSATMPGRSTRWPSGSLRRACTSRG